MMKNWLRFTLESDRLFSKSFKKVVATFVYTQVEISYLFSINMINLIRLDLIQLT